MPTENMELVGKEILVTGGAGFLGQNLASELLRLGAEVTIYDYMIPEELRDSPYFKQGQLHLVPGDIRDEAKIEKVIRGKYGLFDLAGKSGAVDSNQSPQLDLDINCRGHLNILEACRRVNRNIKIVFPSSRLVYGRPLELPVSENHPLAPESIYAAHKIAVENYLRVYGQTAGLNSVILRITIPYGPLQIIDDRPYGVVNKFVQQAICDEEITLFGGGEQSRDFLFVDDLVNAFILAMQHADENARCINIGGEDVLSYKELAEMIVSLAGSGRVAEVPWPDEYRQVETGSFVADIELSEALLGWRPRFSVRDGLKKTVAFYQERWRKKSKS